MSRYHQALHAATLCEQGDDIDEARAVRDLVASHRELLTELSAAHQIIHHALNIMTLEQKLQWSQCNAEDGDDITRARERVAAIGKASEFI